MAGVSKGGTGTNYGGELRRGSDLSGGTPSTTWTVSGPMHGLVGSHEAQTTVGRGQARIADQIPLGLAAKFTASTVVAGWFNAKSVATRVSLHLLLNEVSQCACVSTSGTG